MKKRIAKVVYYFIFIGLFLVSTSLAKGNETSTISQKECMQELRKLNTEYSQIMEYATERIRATEYLGKYELLERKCAFKSALNRIIIAKGRVNRDLGNYNDAISDFLIAMNRDISYRKVSLENIITIKFQQGKCDSVIDLSKQYIDFIPDADEKSMKLVTSLRDKCLSFIERIGIDITQLQDKAGDRTTLDVVLVGDSMSEEEFNGLADGSIEYFYKFLEEEGIMDIREKVKFIKDVKISQGLCEDKKINDSPTKICICDEEFAEKARSIWGGDRYYILTGVDCRSNTEFGGRAVVSYYYNFITKITGPDTFYDVFVHESGHSIFHLYDEYTEQNSVDFPGYPNCAPDLETAWKWWGSLLGPHEEYSSKSESYDVSYYSGCSYDDTNIRPVWLTAMVTPGAFGDRFYFGPVNIEHIKKFLKYYGIRPSQT